MYQIVITVDSSTDGDTGTTGFNVRTMADASKLLGPGLTTIDAAELGVTRAVSRFVCDTLQHMPRIMVAEVAEGMDFDEVVGMMRASVMDALLNGASDLVRETLGITRPDQEEPDAVDWNLAFKHLIKGKRDG